MIIHGGSKRTIMLITAFFFYELTALKERLLMDWLSFRKGCAIIGNELVS